MPQGRAGTGVPSGSAAFWDDLDDRGALGAGHRQDVERSLHQAELALPVATTVVLPRPPGVQPFAVDFALTRNGTTSAVADAQTTDRPESGPVRRAVAVAAAPAGAAAVRPQQPGLLRSAGVRT